MHVIERRKVSSRVKTLRETSCPGSMRYWECHDSCNLRACPATHWLASTTAAKPYNLETPRQTLVARLVVELCDNLRFDAIEENTIAKAQRRRLPASTTDRSPMTRASITNAYLVCIPRLDLAKCLRQVAMVAPSPKYHVYFPTESFISNVL